jgi:hypothetical protein
MIKLPDHNADVIASFYIKMLVDLKNEISNSKLKQSVKDFLTDVKVEVLVTAKPSELIAIHEEFIRSIGDGCSLAEYSRYLKARKKKITSATEKSLVAKYDGTIKKIYKLFDYDNYISKKKNRAYGLSKLIGRNTCTYCNRLYTFTIVVKDPETGRVNNNTRLARPQFDHWYPKKKYPLLALSFYNLIPSCSVCNSSIKGDDDYSLKTHVHPYVDGLDEGFSFSYRKIAIGRNEVILKYNGAKIERTLSDLKIKEIYDAHSGFELQDLLDLRYKYSDNYLDTLFNKTFDLSLVDKQDAYRMLFGTEINPARFDVRPFSKFKYDILKELKIIR